MTNILKMIQSNDMIKVLLILVAVYLFITYMKMPAKSEQLENVAAPPKAAAPAAPMGSGQQPAA